MTIREFFCRSRTPVPIPRYADLDDPAVLMAIKRHRVAQSIRRHGPRTTERRLRDCGYSLAQAKKIVAGAKRVGR